jgi:hypothetical protein
MTRKIVTAVLLIALGAIGATMANWLSVPEDDAARHGPAHSARGTRDDGSDPAPRLRDGRKPLNWDLRSKLDAGVVRETLLAALRGETPGAARRVLKFVCGDAAAQTVRDAHGTTAGGRGRRAGEPPPPAQPPEADDSTSAMERALIAGGLDPNTAADLKRKGDQLQMAQMNLRYQATHEGGRHAALPRGDGGAQGAGGLGPRRAQRGGLRPLPRLARADQPRASTTSCSARRRPTPASRSAT